MKLLLDENLSPTLSGLLAGIYPDTTHVRELGLKSAAHPQVWTYAARHGYTIVTNRRFCYELGGPDHEFLDAGLEALRSAFRQTCQTLLLNIAKSAFCVGPEARWHSVPHKLEEDRERWERKIEQINTAADAVCASYDALVRAAWRELSI